MRICDIVNIPYPVFTHLRPYPKRADDCPSSFSSPSGMAPYGIMRLSNELFRDILDHIEADPDRFVNLDRRSYLSQESFKPPPTPPPDQAQNLANFRLTCRRFSELGSIHQFARVTTRFSQTGFRRLECIASQPHLAQHVKKFSYMVPYFYVEGRERIREVLPTLEYSLGLLDVRSYVRKINDQKQLVQTKEDLRVLQKAIGAFTSLQHVQILRVQDQEDSALLSYIRSHQEFSQLVQLKWAPACSHSTKTIAAALLASGSPCSRFSSPMLSPQSASILAAEPPQSFSPLVERLTCLELHFDDGGDLDSKMTELSSLARIVFTAAKNMQAVHVGFPSHRPLSLRLEEIFHHVRWDKLLAFGIQAWRLDADEIIELARRHREKLKGLRLRDVLLKDGSRWKDVLAFLRREMIRLDWVSLRRIGYTANFDEQLARLGAEVPDDPPGGASESDDESDYDLDWEYANGDDANDIINYEGTAPVPELNTNYYNHYNHNPDNSTDNLNNNNNNVQSDDDGNDSSTSSSTFDDNHDGHGPDMQDVDFASLVDLELEPDTPSSVPWCNCNGRTSRMSGNAEEDLGDNGVYVTNGQRKLWEKWVVCKCLDHGSK